MYQGIDTMYEKKHVFWCFCAFLLVVSSSKLQRDLTNGNKKDDSIMLYELDINSTKNFTDDITTMQYVLPKIFTKDIQYDEMPYETSTMSNHWQKDDSLRNELTTHFIQNDTNNQIIMESQQSKKSPERNTTLQEIHENWMKIDDKNSSTSHDNVKNFNKNNNKNDFVYKMCDNITCIQLCCPIGEHLITDNCIRDENEYFFSKLNNHVNHFLHNENKGMDGLFQWIVREPYDSNKFMRLNSYTYNETGYMLLPTGTLFFPNINTSFESASYCLNALDQNMFDIRICAKTLKKVFRDLIDFDPAFAKDILDIFIIIMILRLLSMLFMLITFLIYSILPDLRNIHGFILRNYCALMFVAYMADMMNNEVSALYVEYPMCITIALLCYYCYLATCVWLTVMSFDMWWTFRDFQSLQRSGKQQEKQKMILYSVYAWGSPFICTVICIIVNFVPSLSRNLIHPKLGIFLCWFNDEGAAFLYYWPPILLCAFSSICLFIITALKIKRYEKDTAKHLKDAESRHYDKNKKWFKLYFQMFTIVFIMVGITWIMAILLWNFSGSIKEWHKYIIYSLDLMQSFGIFVIFVCKKTIKQQLLKHFGCQNCSLFPKTRHSTGIATNSNTCSTTSGTTSLDKKLTPLNTQITQRICLIRERLTFNSQDTKTNFIVILYIVLVAHETQNNIQTFI